MVSSLSRLQPFKHVVGLMFPVIHCRFGKPEPHVWFDAHKVWEVKAADISISPKHQAALGLVEAGKGISIRFPRLVRVRDDKTAEQTTSPEQLAEMYRNQAAVNQGKQPADD